MAIEIWSYSLISVILVSFFSLVGILTLPISISGQKNLLLVLVSFSVGGLFGDAFIHLIPETYESLGSGLTTSLLVISGILVFFILEKFLCWRHCHHPTCDDHPHQLATVNIVGDGLHNFLDGIIIGAAYQVNIGIGMTTTLAIIFHEIPQEIGDFGILLYAGLSRGRALLLNFLSATLAVFGTLVSLAIGPRLNNYSFFLLPLTAGGFIYLAGSDLIPELKKDSTLKQSFIELLCIVLGIGIMVSLSFLK